MKIFRRELLMEMLLDLTTNKIWESRDYGYWINNYFWIDYLIDKYILEQTEKNKYDYQFDASKYDKGKKLEVKNLGETWEYIADKILEEIKWVILDNRIKDKE